MPSASTTLIERHQRPLLWALLAAGLLLRVALTASTRGNVFDLQSLQLVAQWLVSAPGHVYALADTGYGVPRWPYPTGYFPVVLLIHWLAGVTHVRFTELIRVPPALADTAIAWVVQDHLRFRGAGAGTRLAAAALVALGPSFVAISGVHGQIDAVGILPAAVALTVWERLGARTGTVPPRRAWVCGLLIGLGADIKTVPGLMLLALLPSSRSRREAVTLVVATLVIPVLSMLPILVGEGFGPVGRLASYHGGTGLGGLGLVFQPDLALNWLQVRHTPVNGVDLWLELHGGVVALVAVAAAFATLAWRRVPAPVAAVVLWLTVYAFGVQFFMQYMVWGLPFMLLAGYLWQVAALQALLLLPVVITYHGVRHAWVAALLYVAPMIVAWLAETAALGVMLRGIVVGGPGAAGHPSGPAEPGSGHVARADHAARADQGTPDDHATRADQGTPDVHAARARA